jgi:hypothetical protein
LTRRISHLQSLEELSALDSAEDMTRSISSSKKISVDKSKRRESLVQKAETDENENASILYHIVNMKQLKH